MDLTWDTPQVVDYARLLSEMKVDNSPSNGIVGDMGIRRCNRWVQVFEYTSKPAMLGLAKRDVGVDHPLEKQSLKVVPIEALDESVRDSLLFRV
jgi:hypothetical protein